MIQSAIKNKNLLFPALIGAGVLMLTLSLLTIVARSPYTHSNLNLGFDNSYTRTQQMLVGGPVPVTSDQLAVPRATDPVELGKQLFVSNGCAGCHGIDGHGGIIGPSIVGIKAEKLRVKTNVGPKGMLPYAPGALTDQDLAAIAAYLETMSK
jgi:mono/diheme cytochrome c family protein